MADLTTHYMGIKLKNPVIAGACGLTSDIANIKKMEEAGIGAVVTKSLFEEQIQLERAKLEAELHRNENLYAEMQTLFPNIEHAGPKEHLMWVKKTREAINIPVIASLNAVDDETWVDYASQLAETGVDGLELNFYASPRLIDVKAEDIEKKQIRTLKKVKKAVSIPISVKLSPFYSNPLEFIKRLDQAGADAFVLFNRLFQPDINTDEEKNTFPLGFSSETDNRLPLRFTGLLYGALHGQICSSTGIFDGNDVVKMILAGASAVQVVSTLYKNSINHIRTLLADMDAWMDAKNYKFLDDYRGKMSRINSKDAWVYKRSQYVRLLLRSGASIMKDISP